jgi:hypothetical protein
MKSLCREVGRGLDRSTALLLFFRPGRGTERKAGSKGHVRDYDK